MNRFPFILGITIIVVASICHAARADTVSLGTQSFDGTVNGLRNGKLSLTPKSGPERQFDLSEITAISLDQWPQFFAAEHLRGDPLQSVAAADAYKKLIPTINKPELRLLAECRAIDPTDRDNLWTQAVTLFLDVYQAAPTDSLWKCRPTHFPPATSRMLPDSADLVAAALKTAKTDEARNNLRAFLLEIYTRAGDTTAADRLAREISPAAAPDPLPRNPSPENSAALRALEAALTAQNFDAVLQQTAALLPTATGETAVQLFTLQARALEGQQKLELAAAAWLRIPAHYPTSPAAPAALRRAAELEQKLIHPDAAKALLDN